MARVAVLWLLPFYAVGTPRPLDGGSDAADVGAKSVFAGVAEKIGSSHTSTQPGAPRPLEGSAVAADAGAKSVFAGVADRISNAHISTTVLAGRSVGTTASLDSVARAANKVQVGGMADAMKLLARSTTVAPLGEGKAADDVRDESLAESLHGNAASNTGSTTGDALVDSGHGRPQEIGLGFEERHAREQVPIDAPNDWSTTHTAAPVGKRSDEQMPQGVGIAANTRGATAAPSPVKARPDAETSSNTRSHLQQETQRRPLREAEASGVETLGDSGIASQIGSATAVPRGDGSAMDTVRDPDIAYTRSATAAPLEEGSGLERFRDSDLASHTQRGTPVPRGEGSAVESARDPEIVHTGSATTTSLAGGSAMEALRNGGVSSTTMSVTFPPPAENNAAPAGIASNTISATHAPYAEGSAVAAAVASTTNGVVQGSAVEALRSSDRSSTAAPLPAVTDQDDAGCRRDEHAGRLRVSCDGKTPLSSEDAVWLLWAGKTLGSEDDVWSVELAAANTVLGPSNDLRDGSLIEQFAAALRSIPKLAELTMSFKHSDLGQSEARKLLVSLGRLPLLQELSLDFSSSLFFPEATDLAPALGSAGLGSLSSCSQLTSLSLALAGNGLGASGARDLARGLVRLPSLRALTLDVSTNGIQDVGAWALGAGLGRLVDLTSLSLNLRLSSLTATGLLELVENVGALRKLRTLELDVSYNEFGDSAVSTLATSSLRAKLMELAADAALVVVRLNVTGTGLGPSQAEQLSMASDHLRHGGTDMKVFGMPPGPIAAVPVSSLPGDTVATRDRATTSAAPTLPTRTSRQIKTSLPLTTAPVKLTTSLSAVRTTVAPVSSATRTSAHGPTVPPHRQSAQTSKALRSAATESSAASSQRPSSPPLAVVSSTRAPASRNATAEDVDFPDIEGNSSNTTAIGDDNAGAQSALIVMGLLVAVTGSALAWGNGACSPRGNGRESARSGARMSMLGSDDNDEDRDVRPARSAETSAQGSIARSRESSAQRGAQRNPRGGSHSRSNFEDFANFSDNVPVVQSCHETSEGRLDRLDSASDLEAMLEAQVAALDDDAE